MTPQYSPKNDQHGLKFEPSSPNIFSRDAQERLALAKNTQERFCMFFKYAISILNHIIFFHANVFAAQAQVESNLGISHVYVLW